MKAKPYFIDLTFVHDGTVLNSLYEKDLDCREWFYRTGWNTIREYSYGSPPAFCQGFGLEDHERYRGVK